MDRQTLIVTEVLTEYAKEIIYSHYLEQATSEKVRHAFDTGDEAVRDTSLMRSTIEHYETQIESPNFQDSVVDEGTIQKPHAKLINKHCETETTESLDQSQQFIFTSNTDQRSSQNSGASLAEGLGSASTTEQYFNAFYKYQRPPVDRFPNIQPPDEVVIMVFNRKLLLRNQNERIFNKYEPAFFGTQFPILATKSTSRRELYEQVWARVRSQLKYSCYERSNLWWNSSQEFPQDLIEGNPLTPFVLKHVDMAGVSCSICSWSQRCHGCPIEPRVDDNSDIRPLLLRNTYIVCEWDIDFLEKNCDPQGTNCQEHESVSRMQSELDKPQTLSSCIRLHCQSDSMSAHCIYCQAERPSHLTRAIQQCPPVLILHLKRFRVTSYQVAKMQNMVTYPLYDLDMSEHVPFKDPNTSYLYDLYGVVNHFGTMSGGHYTATIKNQRTQEWLYYDDSSVRPYAECDVVSRSAYILFYRRKDLAHKPMSQVVPRLNLSFFTGMPVKTKSGLYCYLIEYREDNACPLVLGVGDGIIIYCKESDIEADPDSEDLSSINKMFGEATSGRHQRNLQALEKTERINILAAEKKDASSKPAAQNVGGITTTANWKNNNQINNQKPKDKERDNCLIF